MGHNLLSVMGLLLVLFGLFVFFTAVVGVFRLHYVLNRMHAAALCDALGVFTILIGLIFLRGWEIVSVKLILILIFLWLTSPVASHLIAEMEVKTHPDPKRESEVERR